MSVFEYRVLRKIFGPKRNDVSGEWKRSLNKKLRAVYCTSNNFRLSESGRMRWVGRIVSTEKRRNVYRILVVRPDGKKTLGRCRRMCEDNIKMDLQHVRWGGIDWIDLAQDRDK